MRQALQLKFGQSLAMTPQLQQAIRLLQLSTLELQTEIQEALESNPLLETVDEGVEVDAEGNIRQAEAASDESRRKKESEAEAAVESATQSVDQQITDNMPDDLAVDSKWDDVYDSGTTPMVGRSEGSDSDFTEYTAGSAESLQDHLLEQLHLTPLSDIDRDISANLVDALDDDGYLRESLETIQNSVNNDREPGTEAVDLDEIEACLHRIQTLDPLGCGARDLGECLSIQLKALEDSASRDLALAVTQNHMDLLAGREMPKIRRLEGVNEAELNAAMALIRSMNPKPGAQITVINPQYIIPDVIVKPAEGGWAVELNPEIAPKLAINSVYANLVKRADKSDDNQFIRNNLQEARWFIKSLQSRNDTLLRVATAIVEFQVEYFEQGEVAMKPLVLRDIAEMLELRESTISRVTTQKYMHTPYGNLEFKYFFSSHVSTSDGGECSATAIRAHIRELVAAEDNKKPLSDNKIATLLVDRGINVARRTIAKYREAMAIAPSNERKLIS